LAVELFENLVG